MPAAVSNDNALIFILPSKCYGSDRAQRLIARSCKHAFVDRDTIAINGGVDVRSVQNVNVSVRVANRKIQTRGRKSKATDAAALKRLLGVRQMRNCMAMGTEHVIKVNLLRRDEQYRQNRGR